MSFDGDMRVLVTSTPGTGHLHPLAPLASALQSAGHEVLWATAEEACERVRSYGFSVIPAGMSLADRLAAFLPHMDEVMALPPRRRRALVFSRLFGWAAAPRMYADLGPAFDTFRPDVVVSEVAELAAAPMAVARCLPHVTVAFSGALPNDAIALLVQSVTPIWAAEGLPVPSYAGLSDDLYLHPFPTSFGDPPSTGVVGPMRMETFDGGRSGESPEWVKSLGVGRPLVYLTSGTESAAVQAPWASMLEAIGSLDVDAVATIGSHVDPSSLGDVAPNVRVERFVPQHWLLERASVVVSHGGAGTMLAAAGRGIPQLLNPIAADQWENADAVGASGAGIVCEPEQRTAADIRAALERLLGDHGVRDAAARVAAEIAAMPPPSAHVAAIEALAAR